MSSHLSFPSYIFNFCIWPNSYSKKLLIAVTDWDGLTFPPPSTLIFLHLRLVFLPFHFISSQEGTVLLSKAFQFSQALGFISQRGPKCDALSSLVCFILYFVLKHILLFIIVEINPKSYLIPTVSYTLYIWREYYTYLKIPSEAETRDFRKNIAALALSGEWSTRTVIPLADSSGVTWWSQESCK